MNPKPITHTQLQLLLLIFKYRFVTQSLVAEDQAITNNKVLYLRIKYLCDRGLVGKRYTPQDKIAMKPAVYYLTALGIKEIRLEYKTIDEAVIKASYRDKTVTDQFIAHNLDIFTVSLKLKQLHPGLQFFTKRQIAKLDYMPNPQPDGFIVLPNPAKLNPDLFILDIIPPIHQRLELRKRVHSYLEFFEGGGWEETKSHIPRLLIICAANRLEIAAQRQINRMIEESYILEFEGFTTTMDRIKNASPSHKNIWTEVFDTYNHWSLDDVPPYKDIDP